MSCFFRDVGAYPYVVPFYGLYLESDKVIQELLRGLWVGSGVYLKIQASVHTCGAFCGGFLWCEPLLEGSKAIPD